MALRRLVSLLVAWVLFGATPPVAFAAPQVAVIGCSPEHGRALLQQVSNDIPAPFVGSGEAAQELTAQAGAVTRSVRERLQERTRRRASVVITEQRVRIAELTYMNYSRALAEANAGLPSWHSTAPPPLS